MTEQYFTNELREYLSEQDIPWTESESLASLCKKAFDCGYSFSDEMYEYFPELIPHES